MKSIRPIWVPRRSSGSPRPPLMTLVELSQLTGASVGRLRGLLSTEKGARPLPALTGAQNYYVKPDLLGWYRHRVGEIKEQA